MITSDDLFSFQGRLLEKESLACLVRNLKMASSGGDGEPDWAADVRPLLSASYTAFETKELPQLIGSIINR